MGTTTGRRSIRRVLSCLTIAALAGSAFVVLAAPVAAVTTVSEITFTNGDAIGEYNEGSALTNQIVARFVDAGNITILRPSTKALSTCDTAAGARYSATIDWLGNGTDVTDGVVTCSSVLDQYEVHGTYTYKDSGSYSIKVTVTDNTDGKSATGTTDTADVNDLSLSSRAGASVTATEGPGKVTVSAAFWDSNPAYDAQSSVDPGLTATIDWGDGTTSPADSIEWPDSSDQNVLVTGSHVYDANTPTTAYTVKVTLHDDGPRTATRTLKATIADAALTAEAAKSFVAPGAQSSSPVVASFKDAAGSQAKAADFTATVNWGDGTSSAGAVAQTAAGAFNVSGTHTYSTAGVKALTIKVTDEEGQTLSMTATATVPALPNTGQPQTPAPSSMPLLPLMALVLGLALAGGAGLLVRRIRI